MKRIGSKGLIIRRMSRLAMAIIAAVALLASMALNQRADGPGQLDLVELPGVTGAGNNVAFAYDRYILVAPYAPSKLVTAESGASELDNHYIYLIDTKKPNSEPKIKSLETIAVADGKAKTLYYPTRLVFDPNKSIVYVRGTRYEETEDGPKEIEVLAYVHLNLDDNGKPVFNNSVGMIDISGVDQEESSEAPVSFAIGRNGSFVAFTNGASIFTYDLTHGYLNNVSIVPPIEHGKDSTISYLDIDQASNTLTVSWNKKIAGEGDSVRYTSELSFYMLEEDGNLNLIKRVYPEDFPNGGYLTSGSNIAIGSDAETGLPTSAFFVTSDGSLCLTDLSSEDVKETAKSLQVFPELAVENGQPSSPRLVKYDPAKRFVGIVKQGFTVQIKRPSNGRPGNGKPRRGVIRELSLFSAIEEPALAMVKLGKKNKVLSSGVFATDFAGEGGLSNFVLPDDGQGVVATYSGKLFSLSLAADLQRSTVSNLGEIGSRVERIDYHSNRASLVAINSLEPDEEGLNINSPGALTITRLESASFAGATFFPSFSPVLAKIGPPAPSIRRPCNIKK